MTTNALDHDTARLVRRAQRMQDQRLANAHVALAEAQADLMSLACAHARMPETITEADVADAEAKVNEAEAALRRARRIHAIAR